MIVLALEMSSAHAGLALLDGEQTVLARDWVDARGAERPLLPYLAEACEAIGGDWSAVDLFAVGRGPGGYTGLRIAVTTMRALALPGSQLVHALSSGEALAAAVLADRKEDCCVVVGDARRNTWWRGVFHRSGSGVSQEGAWAVGAPEDLPAACPADSLVVSPDWDRLAPLVDTGTASGLSWIRQAKYPQAEQVGRCAQRRLASGQASETPLPLYLHPPVAPVSGKT